jgi:membrane-bound serine protease (ClpP class)
MNLRAMVWIILCGALACGAALGQPPAPDPATDSSEAGSDGAATAGTPAPVAAARQADNLAILPIEGEINRYTALSVERRLELAQESGADAVVFELDTPGGEVGAVLEICNMIKSYPLPTVAWVNPDAYSGGAIIALACEEIVVAPYATMGDAAPVAMNPVTFAQGLERTERQKILQPLITEVVDSARRHGYDERLVQAFLTLGIELWLIENVDSGRRVFVTESQYRELFGEEPPRENVRAASGVTQAGADAEPAGDPLEPEIRSAVEQMQELPPAVPDLEGEDASDWRLVEYATDGESLLTLKTEDLLRYGLAAETIGDRADLKAYFGATNVSVAEVTWSEHLVRAMTSLWVRGILIAIFLIAAFTEMIAPGVGLPGAVALVALGLLIGPPALVGAAAWWALAAILLGIGLLVVELLVLPGFGVFGLSGLIVLSGAALSELAFAVAGSASRAGDGDGFGGVGGGRAVLHLAVPRLDAGAEQAGAGEPQRRSARGRG